MKKFMKKEIIALIVIAVLILATIITGAVVIVNNVNQANEKLKNTNPTVTETVSDTVASEDFTTEVESAKPVETTEEATEKENNAENNSTTEATSATSKNTTSTTASTSKSSNNKKPTTSNNSNSNNNSNKKDPIEQIIPETKPVDKKEDILTINGTKCNVGNTITVTIDMKTPKVLENFQGFTEYDSNYLEFVSVKGNVNGLFNNKDSVIYYNGSDINRGYNFTEKGTLYSVTFKVKKAGTTEIKNTIQVLSDQKSNSVDPADCDITIGIFN